jgi:hypothetical protein
MSAWLSVFFVTSVIHATDLNGVDFSLRFPAAISRFASYGDVAGLGNAQAAFEWSSSTNPASAAWPHPHLKSATAITPQFTSLRFNEGTELHVFTEALTLDAGDRGVFLPAAAQIRSNHETTHDGVGFRFDADYFQIQWGKAVMKDWAVGANINVTASETTSDIGGITVARARSESYDIRLGAVHQVLPKLRVGVVLDYALAPARTDLQVFDPLLSSFVEVRSKDITYQFLLRTGIAWEYIKGSTLLIDYQGGVFCNDSGTLRVHRFPVGIEQMVIKDVLFVRAGTTVDTRGNAAFTAGLGVYPSRRFSVDVGYQHAMFPEIRQEFGSSKGLVVSVGIVL